MGIETTYVGQGVESQQLSGLELWRADRKTMGSILIRGRLTFLIFWFSLPFRMLWYALSHGVVLLVCVHNGPMTQPKKKKRPIGIVTRCFTTFASFGRSSDKITNSWMAHASIAFPLEPIWQPSRPIHLNVHIEFGPAMVWKGVLVCCLRSVYKR